MANFRLVAFNQKGQLVPPTGDDSGLVELLAVGTEQSYTVLNKPNLESLLVLISAQDAGALHHHDAKYFTKSELTSTTPNSTGASLIMASNPYGGSANVQNILNTLYADVSALGSLTMEWQNSVKTTTLLAPPLNPVIGDRYLLGLSITVQPSGDWAGAGGFIVEWNGTTWKRTIPSVGMFVSADDNTQRIFYFSGTTWEPKAFELNTGFGFIDISAGVVTLKNLAEKNIIVGDESNTAVSVDTGNFGQIEATKDGLYLKELAIFGGATEYPPGSGLFPDNIANETITHSKLDNDVPNRILGFNQDTNAVALDVIGDVKFTATNTQEMTTSIQPLAVKSGMVDWGSGIDQIDDTDIPANNTPVNYAGGATLRAELDGIDSAIGSLQQKNAQQDSEDLTFLKLDGTRAMSGTLDMGNQTIVNAAEIRVGNIKDQANTAAIDLAQSDALRIARKIIFTGGTKKIENLADGTVSTDAINFGQLSAVQTYLISEIAKKLDKAGDTMSGTLSMGGNLVRNIADGVLTKDAINLGQLQASVTQLQNADTTNLQTAKSYTDAQVLIEKTRAEAAEAQLSTSIAQETSNRQAAITAEANARAAEDLTFVKLDGSRVMTGNLSFGGTKKIVQLANGQDPADAVNKSQLDAVNTSLTNSIASETSARISADTVLSNRLTVLEADPVTKTYVDTADTNLQTQLNNAVSTINTSITALQQQDQTLAASIQTEQTARIAADNALSVRIDTEASTRQSQDTLLSQRIAVLETDPVTKTYVDTQDTNLQNQITTLNTRVTDEITRVDTSIATLSQTVTSNYNSQQLVNQSLQAQITQEVADRTALAQRVTTAEADINTLEQGLSTAQSDIDSLETRATTSETNIQQLQTNVSSLQTQVTGNTNSISTINTLLETVDTTLESHNTRLNTLEADPVTKSYVDSKDLIINNRIDFIISNTDSAALDSLAEIVSAFQTADNNINNAITTLANTAATNLQAEIDRATAAENQLRTDLTSETTARQNADQAINTRIDGIDISIASLESHTTTIASDLASLTTSVGNLQTDFSNALVDIESEITDLNTKIFNVENSVSGLQTSVTTLATDLNTFSASVNTSISQINTSIADAQADITQLDLDLQAEINRATFAESNLSARISTLENAPQPVLSVNQKLPGVNGSVLINTDDVPEGAINKYYSSALFSSDFSLKSTSDLQEGTNLYYTQARFDLALAQKTTTDVAEGSNLYYTDDRVQNKLGRVSGHIVPETDVMYDLGSSTKRFKDLYLSGTTIYLGSIKLSDSPSGLRVESVQTGQLAINTDNIVEGSNLFYTDERVANKVGSLIQNGKGLNWLYNPATSSLTGTVDLTPFTTGDLSEGSNLYFTNTRVNNATLESLDSSVSGGIAAGDTLIVAFSKFVKQVANLQTEIDAEETRALAAENNLQSQIAAFAAEVQALADQVGEDLQQVLTDLTNAITQEQQARISADTAADNRITFLENNYVSKTYVDTEIDQAVSGVQSQISYIIQNTDPAALDSLVEVVNAFQQADANLNGAITNLSTNLQSQIDDLDTRLANVETSVANINQSIADLEEQVGDNLQQAIADIELSISAEQTARIAADTALSSRLDTLELDPVTKTYVDAQDLSSVTQATNSAKSYTDLAVEAEKIRAEAAELVLSNAITAEQQLRISGDADTLDQAKTYADNLHSAQAAEILSVSNALAQEIVDREAGDTTTLQSAKNYTDAQIAAIPPVDLSAYETIVNVDIKDAAKLVEAKTYTDLKFVEEKDLREAGDLILDGKIDTEKARIDAILLSVDADKDTFAEIVALINSIDTQNDSAFASYVLSNDAKILEIETNLAEEIVDRQAGDNLLSDRIAVLETDPVTKTYVDNLVQAETNARELADEALSLRIDALDGQVGNNLQQAIQSLQNADTALSNRITVLEADPVTKAYVDAADANLQSQINFIKENVDQTSIDSLTEIIAAFEEADQSLNGAITSLASSAASNLAAEEAARIAADNALSSRITVLEADPVTKTYVDTQDTQLSLRLDDLELDSVTKSYVDTQDAGIVEDLNFETEERIAADDAIIARLVVLETDPVTKTYVDAQDSQLRSDLNSEITSRSDADTAINQRIDLAESDINDLENLAAQFENDLAQEITDRIAADAGLQLAVNNEISARQAADTAIELQVDAVEQSVAQEILDRQAGDAQTLIDAKLYADNLHASQSLEINAVETALAQEITDRIAADQNLQNQINYITSNIDPATIDSLAEIVEAFSNMDADLLQNISNLSAQLSADLAAETQARIAADELLQAAITQEITDRQSGDASTLASANTYADALNAAQAAEIDSLESNLAQEILDRQAADTLINTAISNEQTARIAADLNLQNQIDYIVSNIDPEKLDSLTEIVDGLNQEITDREVADQQITEILQAHGAILDKITYKPEKESFQIDAGIIANNYIELEFKAAPNSIVMSVDRLACHEGFDFYTEVHNGVTRIYFDGLLAQGASQALEVGENVYVRYERLLDAFVFPIELAVGRVIPAKGLHSITLQNSDITNGYVDLPVKAVANSVFCHSGRLALHEDVDYLVQEFNGITRIVFAGPSAATGSQALQAGSDPDVLHFKYEYYYN